MPAAARGWIPLLAGVAVAAGLRAQAGLDARLKWPNDVLVGGAKIAGILAEQAGDAIVLGIGINVTTRRDELPAAGATSVVLAGAAPDREQLLVAVLGELETWYLAWVAAVAAGRGPGPVPAGTGPGGDPAGLRAEYLRLSATVGQQVRVSMPGGKLVTGRAGDVDATGRLVVVTASGPVAGERRRRRSRPLGRPRRGGRAGCPGTCHDVPMAGDSSLTEGERLRPAAASALEDAAAAVLHPGRHARGRAGPADPAARHGRPAGGPDHHRRDRAAPEHRLFAVPILRWRTTSYELTTRRLRLRSGIVSRSGRDFPLIRISDVSFRTA